jgi:hypothetical protein
MTKERFDIHRHITDKIVNAIERRAGDFRLPWHCAFRNRRFLRRAAGRLTAHRQRLELRQRKAPLGLPQPRQEIAAIPDQ